MELDLTRLKNIAQVKQPEKQPATSCGEPLQPLIEGREYKTTTQQEKPAEGLAEGLRSLQREADQTKKKKDGAIAVYQEYQHNTARSEQLQTDILKGAKQGEDIYSLFLKAVLAISLMTSNTTFYNALEADIRAIYGVGLQQPQPLKDELIAVQGRLQGLREALQRAGEPEDSLQRIRSAVKAHEARAEQLQEQIRRAEGGEN